MKTIKHFVLAFVASLWAAHGVAADRVAPVLPEATTLTPGETYYLYNVGAGKFLSLAENNSDLTFADTGAEVLVTAAKEGGYNVQFTSTERYLNRYNQTRVNLYSYSNPSTSCNWAFTLSGDAYTIQTDSSYTRYYNADQFLGWDGGENTMLNPALASSAHVAWQLIDGEAGAYYCAKLDLYNALQAMDAYDYNVDKFEAIYSDAESTTEELAEAAATLTAGLEMTQQIEMPEWSDYPIFFENDMENPWRVSGDIMVSNSRGGRLTATVVVDCDATLSYFAYSLNDLTVYVDGHEVRRFLSSRQGDYDNRFFEKLTPGMHVIEWQTSSDEMVLKDVGVEQTPTISVELLEPGSLGTEVLYHVNSLNDVRRLKISGPMNDDDWARLKMMANLYAVDFSEAEITAIPKNQFNRDVSDGYFFHEVQLPEGLLSIGERAFRQSYLDEVAIPSTVTEIGAEAFRDTYLKEIVLPDGMVEIQPNVFNHCTFLEHAVLPKNLVSLWGSCFKETEVVGIKFPETLTTIDEAVFMYTRMNPRFPKSLRTIGEKAFSGCPIDSLFVPEGMTELTNESFENCSKLVYVELPTTCCNAGDYYIFDNCNNLKTVVLKSATMFDGYEQERYFGVDITQLTLVVPSYLVNTYKLDDYWYNAKDIQGFSTAEVQNWRISKPLTLGVRDRFEGTPNMSIVGQGSLKVNGDAAMTFDNFYIETNQNDVDYSAIMLSNCDNLSIQGQYTHGFYVNANKWYFISLPFDITVSEIELPEGMQKAVRYYDGAQRASNGTGNNWKDYAEDDVIPAGTGFILQTNKAGWLEFHAMENETKQYVVSNKEFAKALAENPSETVANSGWNLVGNPYQTFYNINHLNFTAPITVWNLDNRRYDAYSIIDDEFVLTPNQAFFVQCPEEVASISFPLEGRQVSEEIVSAQVNTRPSFDDRVAASRRLIDLTLSAGEASDRTRVVLNSEATEDYDLSCDASKFMSMDVTVPQLYTIGADGTTYAINERPLSDGRVRLGLYLPQDGAYTLSLKHRAADEARLVDLQTGTETDLLAGDYHFTGEAGQHDGRFELRLQAGEVTGIGAAQSARAEVKAVAGGLEVANATDVVKVYASGGQLVYEGRADGGVLRVSLSAGLYLVQVSGSVEKVVVD